MQDQIREELNRTETENGAAAYASTGSACLDFFAAAGALRRQYDEDIVIRFMRAFAEDKDAAMKLLFYTRDVRGGLGERRVFRVILRWLANQSPQSVKKNIARVAEFGRWDDLLVLFDTPCEEAALDLLREQFYKDLQATEAGEAVSLLAKWLPSVNASGKETVRLGKRVAKAFGMMDADYRKALALLRANIRIIENNLREKDYTFDYEKQPSRAMYKYRKAFFRNDAERYRSFLSKVGDGTATLHADNVMPYELVEPYLTDDFYSGGTGYMRPMSEEETAVLNATWEAMPDYGGDENALAVVDTSGSMYWSGKPLAAAVALSLGLYFARRNRGVFKNTFLTFSRRPQLIDLKGETFAQQLQYAASFTEVADTNLEAVFDVLLAAAVRHGVVQEELPAKLYILSDMEFNRCVRNADGTVFENARQRYAAHGYRLPDIVFWNIASRNRQHPVTMNEQGVALISGVTPRIFELAAGKTISPYLLMKAVLESERYKEIVA
ncbi:MAG: DUF2828 family protein [Clostridia bacterium]|nr:DUF2828 family protein [Clostridia bacterium]